MEKSGIFRCHKGADGDFRRHPQLLKTDLVSDAVRARVLHLHHNIRMEEVGLDHVGNKRGAFLLEHDGHDVVAYVSLPLELDDTKKHQIPNQASHCHNHFRDWIISALLFSNHYNSNNSNNLKCKFIFLLHCLSGRFCYEHIFKEGKIRTKR